jgi:hypothetical protein
MGATLSGGMGLTRSAMTTLEPALSSCLGRRPKHEANDVLRRELDWARARFAGDDDQHFELSHEYQELRAHSSITSQSERAEMGRLSSRPRRRDSGVKS